MAGIIGGALVIWVVCLIIKALRDIKRDQERARKIEEHNNSIHDDYKPLGSFGTSLDRLKREQSKIKRSNNK